MSKRRIKLAKMFRKKYDTSYSGHTDFFIVSFNTFIGYRNEFKNILSSFQYVSKQYYYRNNDQSFSFIDKKFISHLNNTMSSILGDYPTLFNMIILVDRVWPDNINLHEFNYEFENLTSSKKRQNTGVLLDYVLRLSLIELYWIICYNPKLISNTIIIYDNINIKTIIYYAKIFLINFNGGDNISRHILSNSGYYLSVFSFLLMKHTGLEIYNMDNQRR